MLTPLGISLLRQLADGEFLSGEELAAKVGLTRARVSQVLKEAEAAGLLYVGTSQSYSLQYLTDTDERPEGYGGGNVGVGGGGGREGYIKALDYRTGKVRWRHALTEGGAMGLLTTAGDLLFGGDGSGNFVAYDPSNGDAIWHAGLGANPSNAPITFMLDGRQFVVVGAGDSLYAFTLAR